MPGQTSHRFYDIAPLAPLLEAGYTVLTPNYRSARRIRTEWNHTRAAAGKRAWPTARVEPVERWLLAWWELAVGHGLLPALTPLDPARVQELWRQVIAEHEADSGGYNLLRPAAAAELAGQARETLLRWEVDLAADRTRQAFEVDADCRTFLAWCDRFDKRLAGAGLCTSTDSIAALRRCPADMPRQRLALVDCDDMPPLFHAAVRALAEEVRVFESPGGQARCLAHAFSSRRGELQAIARWTAQTSRGNPEATIGIVLTDMATDRGSLEYLLRREFDCLGENYNALPVNFSTGISLDRAPVVRDALAVLEMVAEEVPIRQVVGLLQSRFLALSDARSCAAQRLVTDLFAAGREFTATADLRYAASEAALGEGSGLALGDYLLAVSGMRELRRTALPSQWIERFAAVLAVWGWPGPGPLDSLEHQQVELWYRTLEEFRAFDAVCGPLDYAAGLALLRRACSGQVSQPQTADSRVQVLGPLEAAGLAFDHLWLCGLQGGTWPAAPRPSPFIPLALQRRLQMPHATAEREWHFCDTLMRQYRRSSGVLHASYSRMLDDVPELPSSLLEDFTWEPLAEPPVVDPAWTRRREFLPLQRLQDAVAPPVSAGEVAALGGGSGLLEDQSQCPFRAFARRRLAVEPLGEFVVAQSPAERGALLHDALYHLWGAIGDHASLLALAADAESRVIEGAVQAALARLPGRRRRTLGTAYWALEAKRLADLLQEWLGVERQRGDFAVAHREERVTLPLGPLEIRLRVDRIDRLPDGSRLIIDYKSGRSSVQDWLGERPARPQLPLYGIAAPDNTAALAFAQVRPRESCYVGLGAVAAAPGINPVEDWEALNGQWRENLLRLAAAFVAGEASVDPLSGSSCTWCGLQPLCRVDREEELAP